MPYQCGISGILRSNRTFMELKSPSAGSAVEGHSGSNRTFMELKFAVLASGKGEKALF